MGISIELGRPATIAGRVSLYNNTLLLFVNQW